MQNADRIINLPPYLFAEIDKMIIQAKHDGVDVISFGIGDPDLPTPENVVQKMKQAVQDPSTHSYPSYEGLYSYRKAIADWYQRRYNLLFDPEHEIVSLIGSKEGIAHLPLCYINSGDTALIPDPGYPVYKTSVMLAGGKPYIMPLIRENNFLPDLEKIPEDVADKAKLLFINYPNNPTGAAANPAFFEKVIKFAHKHQIIIVHDAAYSEIGLDNYNPPSLMQFPGGREIGIEFNSLSKPYNMTGWRIGWAVGSQDIIEALGRLKTNIDSGIFEAVQYAGIEALQNCDEHINDMNNIYQKRRDILVDGLKKMGWNIDKNAAGFYLWYKVPADYTAKEFSKVIFEKTGIFFTPGIGYGTYGEGYIRIALTVTVDRIKEALQRLKNNNFIYK